MLLIPKFWQNLKLHLVDRQFLDFSMIIYLFFQLWAVWGANYSSQFAERLLRIIFTNVDWNSYLYTKSL